MTTLFIGVDVAKATFVAAAWIDGADRHLGEFVNQEAGCQALAQSLHQLQAETGTPTIQLTLEPTGGYELALALFAHQQGWQVSLPNPCQIRDWAKGLGQRAKTDRQDATLLARYGAERHPYLWQPLPEAVSALDSLLRRRTDLEGMLRQERNRQEALRHQPQSHPVVIADVDATIGDLETSLQTIEQAIQAHMRRHPDLKAKEKLLRQVPGVGAKVVLPLLVLLYRWSVLTSGQGGHKRLVAMVGLDPQTYTSGSSVHKRARISHQGNREVLRLLFMGALGGIRGNNPLRDFYQGLVGRGKAKMVALVAAARKVLVWAWAVFREDTPFAAQQARPVSAPAP